MTGTNFQTICNTFLLCCACYGLTHAEKVLVYDPEKGIIFVERAESSRPDKNAAQSTQKQQRSIQRSSKRNSTDLHLGRQKDPPELYFKSGLEYFKNRDFNNALKNFSYADSVDHQPQYMLWKAKTLRQLNKPKDMLYLMHQIIENYTESDVADDALFEIAFYYQGENDYERSSQLYTRLTEQYPFGLMFSTGEEFREIAREQKKMMRAEMINLLLILGYTGDDLNTNYRLFQKKNDLEITGTGDIETVKVIKQMHQNFLDEEEKRASNQKSAKEYIVWTTVAGGIGLANLLILFIIMAKIKAKRNQLSELEKILNDLKLSKI